jgi:hypothetical protein
LSGFGHGAAGGSHSLLERGGEANPTGELRVLLTRLQAPDDRVRAHFELEHQTQAIIVGHRLIKADQRGSRVTEQR